MLLQEDGTLTRVRIRPKAEVKPVLGGLNLDSMMKKVDDREAGLKAETPNRPSSMDILASLQLEYGVEKETEKVESEVPFARTGTVLPGSSKGVKLSQIGELILMSDASIDITAEGGEEAWGKSRSQLAASLGCTTEDLADIVDSYGDAWMELILNERIRRGTDSIAMRDVSWDRLESAVLRKLLATVDRGAVKDVGELLAIARVANTAARGRGNMGKSSGNGGGGGDGNQINIGFFPGNPAAGVLPSGNLGTIQLSLSSRVKDQLSAALPEAAKVIDGQSSRILDNIEMVDLDSVQNAVKESEG